MQNPCCSCSREKGVYTFSWPRGPYKGLYKRPGTARSLTLARSLMHARMHACVLSLCPAYSLSLSLSLFSPPQVEGCMGGRRTARFLGVLLSAWLCITVVPAVRPRVAAPGGAKRLHGQCERWPAITCVLTVLGGTLLYLNMPTSPSCCT